MDYKYIEQLLERYWKAETSIEEEDILRAFFSQQDIPAALKQYQPLFTCQQEDADIKLGEDFDERILALTEDTEVKPVKARTISLQQQLRPLFKAAAVIAIIFSVGGALQHPWDASWNDPRIDYANSYIQQIDTADTIVPMQAENITDAPADSSKAVNETLHKE